MRCIYLCAVFTTLVLFFSSCGDDPVQTISYLTGTVTGKVLITDEYEMVMADLSGSTVQLVGTKTYTTTTKPDGTFTFEKVDQGIYTLNVSAAHHQPISLKQIQFVGNGTLELGEFRLPRTWFNNSATFSVSIVDENGNFVNDPSGLVLTLSNSVGFSMIVKDQMNIQLDSLPEGMLNVKVEKEGYLYDSTAFRCYRLSQPVKIRVFKPSFNFSPLIDPPEFKYSIKESSHWVDSMLNVQIKVRIEKDWASNTEISSILLAKLSDSNNHYGYMGVEKNSTSEYIFSTTFRKKAPIKIDTLHPPLHEPWESASAGSYSTIVNKQFYVLLKGIVKSFSPEHRNYRFPDGLVAKSSKIVPFTIAK